MDDIIELRKILSDKVKEISKKKNYLMDPGLEKMIEDAKILDRTINTLCRAEELKVKYQ